MRFLAGMFAATKHPKQGRERGGAGRANRQGEGMLSAAILGLCRRFQGQQAGALRKQMTDELHGRRGQGTSRTNTDMDERRGQVHARLEASIDELLEWNDPLGYVS